MNWHLFCAVVRLFRWELQTRELEECGIPQKNPNSSDYGSTHDVYTEIFWRIEGRLMVSALASGSSGPSLSPGRGHCVVFLGRYFTLAVPLSTQVYKWVPANLMLGVAL